MSDDLTKRRPQDAAKINVHEPYELRDWAKHFGVSEAKIKEAVAAVGDSTAKVEEYLKRHG